MTTRPHQPRPDTEPTSLTLRQRAWESGTPLTVATVPHRFNSDAVEVYLLDGTWIGTVGSYSGSLDRKDGRLRIPGKTRKLWFAQATYEGARGLYEFVSRADAIRWLAKR